MLIDELTRAGRLHTDRVALEFSPGRTVTYGELMSRAVGVANALELEVDSGGPTTPITAVLADRTPSAFVGVLAALFRGHAFMPLNPRFPTANLAGMIRSAGASSMVVEPAAVQSIAPLLDECPTVSAIALPELDRVPAALSAFVARGGRVVLADGCAAAAHPPGQPGSVVGPNHAAYVMFTSGSSGAPKGVAVPNRAFSHLLGTLLARYDVGESDRFSHITPLAFDCALIEIFVAWLRGACVCVPTPDDRINLRRYITERRLTVWVASPSTAALMRGLGGVEPGLYPTLRISLFGSEGLPVDLASAWAQAAPNSIVDNVYGPTELTVCCTGYRFDPATTPRLAENGLVPIGAPHAGLRALVTDDELRPVPPGAVGELLVSGPQVALGYLNAPDQTAGAFVVPPGESEVFYRTRDRVRHPHPGEPYTFLGRLDDQIKIHGMRVEPGEVEAAVRRVTGADAVAAVGWPVGSPSPTGVVAFVEASHVDTATVTAALREELPPHMVPRRVIAVDALPRNANGKIDRRALATLPPPAP